MSFFFFGGVGRFSLLYYDFKHFVITNISGIRLVGGSRCSGRLEVPHGNTWHAVCDTVFDQQDAEVVCRELDCGSPVQVLGAAAFDKGDVQMWTQEIQCRGNESYISFCPTSTSLKHNCTPENYIGLLCSVMKQSLLLLLRITNNFLKHICYLFHTVELNSLFFVQVTLISDW